MREIEDIPTLETHLRRHALTNVVVQGLDLRGFEQRLNPDYSPRRHRDHGGA